MATIPANTVSFEGKPLADETAEFTEEQFHYISVTYLFEEPPRERCGPCVTVGFPGILEYIYHNLWRCRQCNQGFRLW